MLKFILFSITTLLSYQVLSVDAGCSCQAANQTCVMTCGSGLVQCIYGCEINPTDACANGCLDLYWPIIGSEEEMNSQLPFVKRDADPTVMPSGHHEDEDGDERGHGDKNRGDEFHNEGSGGEFHNEGSHNSHNGERKEGDGHDGVENYGPKNEEPIGGVGRIDFPPDKNKEESHHSSDIYDNFKDGPKEDFYQKDGFGPREDYRGRSMAVTSEAFTKATISILVLAITGACMIAF